MSRDELLRLITEKFPEVAVGQDASGTPVLTVPREGYLDLCWYLRREAVPPFDTFSFLAVVDQPDRFEVVIHLLALQSRQRVAVKTSLSKTEPEIPSVVPIWPGANWHEREAYDLFGVRFTGHPALKRILLTEDFPGYPLRKDFQPRSA